MNSEGGIDEPKAVGEALLREGRYELAAHAFECHVAHVSIDENDACKIAASKTLAARAWFNLGHVEKSFDYVSDALNTFNTLVKFIPRVGLELAYSLDLHGDIHAYAMNYKPALKSHVAALAIRRRLLGTQHPIAMASAARLAFSRWLITEGVCRCSVASVKKAFERAIVAMRSVNTHQYGTAELMSEFGGFLLTAELYHEALAVLEEARAMQLSLVKTPNREVVRTTRRIGFTLNCLERWHDAADAFKSAFDMSRTCSPYVFAELALCKEGIGNALTGLGAVDDAEMEFGKCEKYSRKYAVQVESIRA